MTTLFDLAGKVAIITGSSRGIGKAIAQRMAEHERQGGDLVAQGRALRRGGRRNQRPARRGDGDRRSRPTSRSKEDLQRLVGRDAARRSARSTSASATPRPTRLRPAGRHRRRRVPQDPGQQHHQQSLADLDGRAGDARAEGRVDHHRLVDRRPARQRRDRRLQHLQGRRLPAGPQPGPRVRPATTCGSTASRRA